MKKNSYKEKIKETINDNGTIKVKDFMGFLNEDIERVKEDLTRCEEDELKMLQGVYVCYEDIVKLISPEKKR